MDAKDAAALICRGRGRRSAPATSRKLKVGDVTSGEASSSSDFLQKFRINEQKVSPLSCIVTDTFFLLPLSIYIYIYLFSFSLILSFRISPIFPLHFFPPTLSLTATSIERGTRVGEVNATRRDITSFPLNSLPLSIRAISRQRSDRYNRFGLIPVNCRRPKFANRVPREQAIPHLRQASNSPHPAPPKRRKPPREEKRFVPSSLFPRLFPFREISRGCAFSETRLDDRIDGSTIRNASSYCTESVPGRFSCTNTRINLVRFSRFSWFKREAWTAPGVCRGREESADESNMEI